MVVGENGYNGQLVEPTVRSQEQEAVMILHHKMEEWIVKV